MTKSSTTFETLSNEALDAVNGGQTIVIFNGCRGNEHVIITFNTVTGDRQEFVVGYCNGDTIL